MNKKIILISISLVLLLSVSLSIFNNYTEAKIRNDVLFSFWVTADSQISPQDSELSISDNKWKANSRVFTRILREMSIQRPIMLFFCGDSIWGNTHGDIAELNRQYAYWRGIISGFAAGCAVFPVAGNHEMLDSDAKTGNDKASIKLENAWRDNMGDLIPNEGLWEKIFSEKFARSNWNDLSDNRGNNEKAAFDHSKLNYSFDYKGSHFIIINTYPIGNEHHVPIARLRQDVTNAKRRGIKHIFIFGHEPAFSYKFDKYASPRGLDIDSSSRDQFWEFVNNCKATYFCAHDHLFNASQPDLKLGKAYQIIVGPAGGGFKAKPAEQLKNPQLSMYSWVTVKVYKNDKIHIAAYGFDKKLVSTKVIKCWELEKDF